MHVEEPEVVEWLGAVVAAVDEEEGAVARRRGRMHRARLDPLLAHRRLGRQRAPRGARPVRGDVQFMEVVERAVGAVEAAEEDEAGRGGAAARSRGVLHADRRRRAAHLWLRPRARLGAQQVHVVELRRPVLPADDNDGRAVEHRGGVAVARRGRLAGRLELLPRGCRHPGIRVDVDATPPQVVDAPNVEREAAKEEEGRLRLVADRGERVLRARCWPRGRALGGNALHPPFAGGLLEAPQLPRDALPLAAKEYYARLLREQHVGGCKGDATHRAVRGQLQLLELGHHSASADMGRAARRTRGEGTARRSGPWPAERAKQERTAATTVRGIPTYEHAICRVTQCFSYMYTRVS